MFPALRTVGGMHESQFVLNIPLQVPHSKLQQRLLANLLEASQEKQFDSSGPVQVKQLGEQQWFAVLETKPAGHVRQPLIVTSEQVAQFPWQTIGGLHLESIMSSINGAVHAEHAFSRIDVQFSQVL